MLQKVYNRAKWSIEFRQLLLNVILGQGLEVSFGLDLNSRNCEVSHV